MSNHGHLQPRLAHPMIHSLVSESKAKQANHQPLCTPAKPPSSLLRASVEIKMRSSPEPFFWNNTLSIWTIDSLVSKKQERLERKSGRSVSTTCWKQNSEELLRPTSQMAQGYFEEKASHRTLHHPLHSHFASRFCFG